MNDIEIGDILRIRKPNRGWVEGTVEEVNHEKSTCLFNGQIVYQWTLCNVLIYDLSILLKNGFEHVDKNDTKIVWARTHHNGEYYYHKKTGVLLEAYQIGYTNTPVREPNYCFYAFFPKDFPVRAEQNIIHYIDSVHTFQHLLRSLEM